MKVIKENSDRKHSRESEEKRTGLKRSKSVVSHRCEHSCAGDGAHRRRHRCANHEMVKGQSEEEANRVKSVERCGWEAISGQTGPDTESASSKIKRFYERLLESKEAELATLRNTHRRRLERLISLEKEHKLLLEHVDALEPAAQPLSPSSKTDHKVVHLVGYKRKDNESLWNEMKLVRTDNSRLKADNLALQEACDLFEVKLSEKLQEVEALQLELNVNLNQRQAQYSATKVDIYFAIIFFFLEITIVNTWGWEKRDS